jgi:hypothetical protein
VSGALAGLVILVIGDSHAMHMMPNLNPLLAEKGAIVHSYSMCGATPGDWIYPSSIATWGVCGRAERHEKGPVLTEAKRNEPTYSLAKLIAEHHPNLIIVQGGDTIEGFGPTAKIDRPWALDQIHALTGKIAAANIACDWVGPTWEQNKPPLSRNEATVKEMVQFLSQSVAPCKYIDSTTYVRPGEWQTTDGLHLLPDGYRQWSTDIANTVAQLNSQKTLSSR